MKHNIIFLEGLPGSGKTTYLRRLKKDLRNKVEMKMYEEGMINPIDLGYCAVMPHAIYTNYLNRFEAIKDSIEQVSMNHEDFVVTAFTKISRPTLDDPFYHVFGKYQLDQYADFETFKSTYIALWEKFSKNYKDDKLYLYGGAFLQNHFEILYLRYGLSKVEMMDYFKALIKTLKPLNPLIVYIKQQNIKQTIDLTAKKRTKEQTNGYKDWIDMVIDSFDSLPLAKAKGYTGLEGAYRFYEDEQQFELELLNNVSSETLSITLNKNYDHVYYDLYNYVKKSIEKE